MTDETVKKQAREKAATMSGDELQQEILAQLYLLNYSADVEAKKRSTIKSHLLFYSILLTINFLIVLFYLFS